METSDDAATKCCVVETPAAGAKGRCGRVVDIDDEFLQRPFVFAKFDRVER